MQNNGIAKVVSTSKVCAPYKRSIALR